MSAPRYAPKRADGLMAYVIVRSSWGRQSARIEWAHSLAQAKAEHGYTREQHTTIRVRRASPEDVALVRGGSA